MKSLFDRLQTRSVVVLVLVVGSFFLAIRDEKYRAAFADLAKIGVGGYLAQIIPGVLKKDGS